MAQSPANLIVNGGAEDGNGKSITGWGFRSGGLTSDQLTWGVSPDASEGKHSFQISVLQPVPAQTWWAQEFLLPANAKSVQVSFAAKQKTDVSRTKWAVPSVGCWFLDKSGKWIVYQSLREVVPSDAWVTYRTVANVPEGAARMGVRLNVGSLGVIDALFDDVRAVPLEWTVKRTGGTDKQAVADVITDAADSKRSLHLASVDSLDPIHVAWTRATPVTPGITRYTISLKAKVRDGAGDSHADATMGYAFLDDKRHEIGYQPFAIVTGKDWHTYAVKVVAPAGTALIEARLCLDGTGESDAYFDSLSVLPE